MNSNTSRTPKNYLTNREKNEVLDDLEKNIPHEEIMQKFGLKNRSNIYRIIKSKDAIRASLNNHNCLNKIIVKHKNEHIDKALVNFISNCNTQGVPVTDTSLIVKAIEISNQAGNLTFKASNGYMEKFKKRQFVTCVKCHGEAASVPPQVIVKWHESLRQIIKNVDPENIWNADEFALFWRMQPNKSYVANGEVFKFGKQSRERVTGFVCANMLGEKADLTIICKSENPRNIQMIKKLPVSYFSNKTAWMTGEIFSQIMEKWNSAFVLKDRFILLFIDNCKAHPAQQMFNFSNIKVFFLPPNSTSVTHPMDAGVVKCLKGLRAFLI